MKAFNLSITGKVTFLSIALIVSIIAISWTASSFMRDIGEEIVSVTEEDIPLSKAITQITISMLEESIRFERVIRTSEEMVLYPHQSHNLKQSIQSFNEYSTSVSSLIAHATSLTEKIIATTFIESVRADFIYVIEQLNEIASSHEQLIKETHDIFTNLNNNQSHNLLPAIHKLGLLSDKINHQIESLLTHIETFTENALLLMETHEKHAMKNILGIAGISIVVALFLATIINIAIRKGLYGGIQQCIEVSRNIASGKLTEKVPTDRTDELGILLRELEKMRCLLHATISSISNTSIELSGAAEQIAVVSEQTSESVTAQQKEIEQFASAMTEMGSSVSEVSKNASSSSKFAAQADADASNSQQQMNKMINSIEQFATNIDAASNVVANLGDQSDSISNVMSVIKSIAEQTNLLALNAAIEAARAGEQGRGFAVVADEVRTLASRTQESAAEIEEMINSLQSSARAAVQSMQHNQQLTDNNVQSAKITGTSLSSIITSISSISSMNTQVANASQEQAAVTDEMHKNVISLQVAGEQLTGVAHESAQSGEELANMANSLRLIVSKFVI